MSKLQNSVGETDVQCMHKVGVIVCVVMFLDDLNRIKCIDSQLSHTRSSNNPPTGVASRAEGTVGGTD